MLTAIQEILSSLKDNARERIKNPLIGSFILSWCVYNWDIILRFYFINNDVQDVKTVIDTIEPFFGKFDRYLWPLTVSLFFVGISPWLTVGIQKLRSKALRKAKTDKLNFELKTLEDKKAIITQEAENDDIKNKKIRFSKNEDFLQAEEIKKSKLSESLEKSEVERQKIAEEKKEFDKVNQAIKVQIKGLVFSFIKTFTVKGCCVTVT